MRREFLPREVLGGPKVVVSVEHRRILPRVSRRFASGGRHRGRQSLERGPRPFAHAQRLAFQLCLRRTELGDEREERPEVIAARSRNERAGPTARNDIPGVLRRRRRQGTLDEPLEQIRQERTQARRRVELVPIPRGGHHGRGGLDHPTPAFRPQHRVGVQRPEKPERQRSLLVVYAPGEHRHEPTLPASLPQHRVRVPGGTLHQREDQFQHPRAHLALLARLQESKEETRRGRVHDAGYARGGRPGFGLERHPLRQLHRARRCTRHRPEESTGRVLSRGFRRRDGYAAKGSARFRGRLGTLGETVGRGERGDGLAAEHELEQRGAYVVGQREANERLPDGGHQPGRCHLRLDVGVVGAGGGGDVPRPGHQGGEQANGDSPGLRVRARERREDHRAAAALVHDRAGEPGPER